MTPENCKSRFTTLHLTEETSSCMRDKSSESLRGFHMIQAPNVGRYNRWCGVCQGFVFITRGALRCVLAIISSNQCTNMTPNGHLTPYLACEATCLGPRGNRLKLVRPVVVVVAYQSRLSSSYLLGECSQRVDPPTPTPWLSLMPHGPRNIPSAVGFFSKDRKERENQKRCNEVLIPHQISPSPNCLAQRTNILSLSPQHKTKECHTRTGSTCTMSLGTAPHQPTIEFSFGVPPCQPFALWRVFLFFYFHFSLE